MDVNGDVYDGNWMHDKKHNMGKMNYANGEEYEGNWENDMKCIIK